MDVDELKEILRVLDERRITEFELEKEGIKLRVRKAVEAPAALALAPQPAVALQSVPAAPAAGGAEAAAGGASGAEGEDDGSTAVKSPIVGTFYRAPAPTAAAFEEVGDRVRVGQVLCIVEAMKLMNEIESEVAGEVVKIHIDNAQPVQYGETLFSIRPA